MMPEVLANQLYRTTGSTGNIDLHLSYHTIGSIGNEVRAFYIVPLNRRSISILFDYKSMWPKHPSNTFDQQSMDRRINHEWVWLDHSSSVAFLRSVRKSMRPNEHEMIAFELTLSLDLTGERKSKWTWLITQLQMNATRLFIHWLLSWSD